jgi:hypothetical protein
VHARGQRVAAAFLARTRWKLLSLPYRPPPHADAIDRDEDLSLVDGTSGWLRTRARQARDDWLAMLDSAEDHTLLRQAVDVEDEILDLTSVPLGGGHRAGDADAVDAAVWRHCVRHHLLPRFAVCESARVVARIAPGRPRTITLVARWLAGLGVLLAVAAMTGLVPGGITAAAAVAAAVYLLLGAAAVAEPATSWPWLLRQPASAVLGLLVLVALTPHWWHRSYPNPAAAAAVLTLAAVCYLAVEALNHGVARRRTTLLKRVGTVTGIGLVHATLVATIALRWVFPVFADSGGHLKCLWGSHMAVCHTSVQPAWALLTLAITWSFTAGVFSQILWDEQPVTAPLAHIRWTGGRKP